VYWCPPDDLKFHPLRSIPVRDITDIRRGKKTPALQTHLTDEIPEEYCFSVISNVKSMDLQAGEDDDAQSRRLAEDWYNALVRLRAMEDRRTEAARFGQPLLMHSASGPVTPLPASEVFREGDGFSPTTPMEQNRARDRPIFSISPRVAVHPHPLPTDPVFSSDFATAAPVPEAASPLGSSEVSSPPSQSFVFRVTDSSRSGGAPRER